MLQQNKIT